MNRPPEPLLSESETRPVSPWLEAALRAKDPTAFRMGLGETEFAVLLAEREARRLPMSTLNVPGRTRRQRNQSRRPW